MNAIYSCQTCGAQTTKWSGRCLECNAWGSVSLEENVSPAAIQSMNSRPGKTESFALLETQTPNVRHITGLASLDRVLSGGLVPGSVTLIGGEPGIGKSTLLSQLGLQSAATGNRVLYVTGEESPSQIFLRLKRLVKTVPPSFSYLDITHADVIAATIREQKPAFAIVDSIQSLRAPEAPGEAGNPTQIRACAALINETAKQTGIPVLLVGQVTKDGDLAGPRLLEHLVDTVCMIEGDRLSPYRMLRVLKHRFGTTEESAVLAMTEFGLEEVLDPSTAFLSHRAKSVSGSVVSAIAEGSRAILVELQALVTQTGFGIPSRRVSGVDLSRVNLLLAVLHKRANLSFGDQDVFVNAVAGLEAKDSSMDLALALALASAKIDRPIPSDLIACGEIGLAGEIRPVTRLALRLKEAARLGFATAVVPPNQESLMIPEVNIIPCTTIKQALETAGLSGSA